MQNSKSLSLEEYAEPVFYCKSCHSLHIIQDVHAEDGEDGWDGAYCGKCNSTDIGTCPFGQWLEEEERREEKRRIREWNR